MADSKKTVSFTSEAKALVSIAEILDGMPRNEALRVLAAASIQLGHIEEAKRFIELLEIDNHA